MRFRKGNYEFSLLGPISAKKNLSFYVFDHPKNFASFSLGFHISEKRSERLKTYPSVDLPSRSHAFGVVTAALGVTITIFPNGKFDSTIYWQ